MEYDNYALKEWLLRVGTMRRKIILQKLKKQLEEYGMIQQEVYRGLLQLVMRPQVALTTLNIAEALHPRSHVNEDTTECEEPTPAVGGEKLPATSAVREFSNESDPTEASMRCEKIDDSLIATTTIPELLDEDIGNRISSFDAKVPRTVITLHLNSHDRANTKKNCPQIRPAPEIRMADSSVPDVEGTEDSMEKYISKRDNTNAPKRPRIIEDLTCVEGTIFDRSSLSKKSKCHEIVEEEIARITANTLEDKRKNMNIEATKKWRLRRKFRQLFGKTLTLSEMKEENDLINELIPKKRRKESRMSLDSGICLSEVASERISDSPDAEIREKIHDYVERRFPAVQDEISLIESKEKSCDFDPHVRSMPLLDVVPPEKMSEDAISKTLPDSSTNNEDKPEVNLGSLNGNLKILISPVDMLGADSFAPMSLEINLSNGSQISTATSTTQLLSKGNASITKETNNNDDDLSKLLEMNLKKDCHITLQGNTISIQEEVDARAIPLDAVSTEKDVDIERRVADITAIVAEISTVTSQTKCELNAAETSKTNDKINYKTLDNATLSSARESCHNDKIINSKDSNEKPMPSVTEPCNIGDKSVESEDSHHITISSVTDTCHNDNKLNPKNSNQRTVIISAIDYINSQAASKSVDFAPEIEEIAIKKELPDIERAKVHEEQKNTVDDTPTVIESTKIERPRITSPAELSNIEVDKSTPNPMPKLRVLHHSELGSRWCPTPINGSVSSTYETEKCAQYQPPIPSVPTVQPYVQAANNAQNNQLENELRYLQLFMLNSAPVITTNAPDLYSKEIPNVNNNSKTQPVQPPPNYSIRQETTSMKEAPISTTVNLQSDTPNYSFSANDNYILPHGSMISHIFDYLLALQWCVERCQFSPIVYDPVYLRKHFFMKKVLLYQELKNYCTVLGTYDLNFVVPYIIQYYDYLMRPEDRILSVERVMYILRLKDLPLPNYVEQREMQSAQAAPTVAYHSPATAAMNSAPRRPHTAKNSTRCNAQKVEHRPVASATAVKQKSPVFSPEQLKTFYDQIIVYNCIDQSLRQQLAAPHQSQEAKRQRTTRDKPKEMSLQEKLKKRAIKRRTDRCQVSMVASPSEVNIANDQPELRQSPVAPMQQEIFTSQRRTIDSNLTVILPLYSAGGQFELRQNSATSAQQATSRGPILCGRQAKIPVSLEHINSRQELPQSVSSSAQKLIAPKSVLYTALKDVPMQMGNTNAELELRKSPSEFSHRSSPQKLFLCTNETNIAATTDNADAQLELRESPVATVEKITIQKPIQKPLSMNNINSQFELRKSPVATVEKITLQKPFQKPLSMDNTNAQLELRQSPAAQIQEISAQDFTVCNNSTSIVKSTNKDNIVDRGQHELQESPAKQIHDKAASSHSKIIQKLSGNGCTLRVVDALEEFDALSLMTSEIRSRSSVSCSPIALPQTESIPHAATINPTDLIATSDADKIGIQEIDEGNNSCTSIQSVDESTELAVNQVPIITISDDDEDDNNLDVRSIKNLKTLKESKSAETAWKGEKKTKDGTLLESAVVARKAEKETIDGTFCESTEMAKEIEDEPTEIFSILDVKSISKDVFNNMGGSVEVESALSPKIQEVIEIDSVDIKDEIMPNCFRCDKPSSVVCEQCCLAFYCSAKCHHTHWTEIHHLLCKPVPEEVIAQL